MILRASKMVISRNLGGVFGFHQDFWGGTVINFIIFCYWDTSVLYERNSWYEFLLR